MAGNWLSSLVLGLMAFLAVDDPDPAELARQLGSPRFADREAAGEALVKLGLKALPALAKATEGRDPEVRLRAEALASRIEAIEVLSATPVALDIRDRPLEEAIETIAKRSGQRIESVQAQGRPRFPPPPGSERRVTLVSDSPVPFWDALDRLCRAGGLRRELSSNGPDFAFGKPPFGLTLAPGAARPPASDTGSLRVELLRVRHYRERTERTQESLFVAFGPPPAEGSDPKTGVAVRWSYTADLLVSAEPRLRIFGVGAVEQAEAVDDRGRSLLKRPTLEEENQRLALREANPHLDPRLHPALRYEMGSYPSMRTRPVSVELAYPSPPAGRIARLRGIIPVVVAARRPDPLVFALKGATGRVFSAGPARISVHEVKAETGREPTVDLTLEAPEMVDGDSILVGDAKGNRLAVRQPNNLMELRLDVIDGRGEILSWQYTKPPTEQSRGRMTIVIRGQGGNRPSTDDLQVRFWGIIAASADLPFAFQDIPTP